MNQHPEVALTGLKIFVALAVILGCLFVISYLLKRHVLKDRFKKHGKLINIIENKYIGVKKSILAVQIPNAILIIGLSNDNICLLDKIIGHKDLVDQNDGTGSVRTFANYISDASEKAITDH
jgi:flagellar biogenesis protein FliO